MSSRPSVSVVAPGATTWVVVSTSNVAMGASVVASRNAPFSKTSGPAAAAPLSSLWPYKLYVQLDVPYAPFTPIPESNDSDNTIIYNL